ncbi:MAG: NAD-dependent 4,6-dehydratase LegB [Bacillota bacterium]
MDLKGKKVIVTGAEGFIGSHLVERLVEKNCDVTAFVQYNSFNNWGWIETFDKNLKDSIKVVQGDIRDYSHLKNCISGNEVVMHLAALIAIPYSYHSPDAYVNTNITGTLNVMQACKEAGIAKIVHTSTSEVYGTAQYVPIDEKHPLHAQSPYAATKIGADKIAESFHLSFGLPVATIRPFNTYGPRQSARAIIPTIISQVLAGSKTIKLGNLEPTRDFNYVLDTVNGFILVAENDNTVGEVINVGSGKEITIGELAKSIFKLMDADIEIQSDMNRHRPETSEVYRLWSNISKAQNIIGYSPKFTLEEGLSATIDWMRINKSSFKTDIYNI